MLQTDSSGLTKCIFTRISHYTVMLQTDYKNVGAIKMAIKMKTVTSFYDEDGKIITESERVAEVPGIEEIEKEGFRAAFNQLETTVLETTDSTRQAAVSGLMEEFSKKKRNQKAKRKEPL